MITQNSGRLLRALGLNSYELKMWAALLSRKSATAGELADMANVPRSRSYDVLESLEKKGFINKLLSKPLTYGSIPPQDTLEYIKLHSAKEAEKESRELSALKTTATLHHLAELHESGSKELDPRECSAVIKGRQNIIHHLHMAVERAEKTLSLSTTAQEFLKITEIILPVIKKKRLSCRVAVPLDQIPKNIQEEWKDVTELKDAKTPVRFAIIDKKELLFMILDVAEVHPAYDIAISSFTPLAYQMDMLFAVFFRK